MLDEKVFVINNHQILGFNKMFAKTEKCKVVFFPGCSLGSLGSEIIEETLWLLKSAVPEIGLSTFCCGKPSSHIKNGKDVEKRIGKLKASIDENGIKKIYTACPNCLEFLKEQLDIEIKSVWPLVDSIIEKGSKDYQGKKMIIHDPCSARLSEVDHDSVRNILEKLNVETIEPEHSKNRTLCCGQKNMMMVLDKDRGEQILQKRIKEFGEIPVVTYCNSCSIAFRGAKKESNHILEVIFDNKRKGSWANRYKTARLVKS